MYSNPWKREKIIPKEIVKIKAILDLLKLFFNISWWDHVTVTPEDKSKIVFIRGILIGLKARMVIGGHAWPISIVGEILLWKKAQKNETKKKTSDEIKSTIPVFSPFITKLEWLPCLEDSRWMSRHHVYAITSIVKKAIRITKKFFLLIITSLAVTNDRIPLDANKGHGLWSTRWNGLNLFIIILFLLCKG